MQIAIRVDSSSRLGSGHVVRCLTLANELRGRGASVRFVSREHEGNLIARIEAEGFEAIRLPGLRHDAMSARVEDYAGWLGVSEERDAQQTLAGLHDAVDWLVVDQYALGARWERLLRPVATRILAVDDLADREHDSDALLDQNYFGAAASQRYRHLVGASCVQLLGPRFALVQPEYRWLRPLIPARVSVSRVLVFFGGSDLPNDTARVLEALSCPELEHLAVDVVVGQNHPDPAAVRAWVDGRHGAAFHSGLATLAGLMARADLAIGGGGSTTWERASLALPAVIVSLADNQRQFSEALAADGYQVLLGRNTEVTSDGWRRALLELIGDPQRLSLLSRRAASLSDAEGSRRVVDFMLDPSAALPASN